MRKDTHFYRANGAKHFGRGVIAVLLRFYTKFDGDDYRKIGVRIWLAMEIF